MVTPKHLKIILFTVSLAVIVGLTLSLWVSPILAHANLVTAEPAPNSVLDESPESVTIWFTEPLEREFSKISVINSLGERVDNNDTSFDPNDTNVMFVTLPSLPNGTYTVVWNNLSTVDGHTLRGSFLFSIGEPLADGSASDVLAEGPLFQTPGEPILRWLVLLTALASVGGLSLELLVSRPVFTRRETNLAARNVGRVWTSRTVKFSLISLALLFLASIAQLVIQTSAVFDVSALSAGGSAFVVLADTNWGNIWIWRVVLLGLMASTLVFIAAQSRNQSRDRTFHRAQMLLFIVALVFGFGMLLTLSLTSHAAATSGIEAAAIFNDYLHLLAVGVWVGGLFHLAAGIHLIIGSLNDRDSRSVLSALVPRFSIVAALSVGVLIVTGLYSAWAQVTILPALFVPYGLSLIAKVALILPILLLAAVNLLWVRPRLQLGGRSAFWLRWLVTGEVVLAVLILLAVGFLTGLEPARQVASRLGIGQQDGLKFEDISEGANISLEIEPGQVGRNRLTVSLTDPLGRPIDDATDVRVRTSFVDADLGEEFTSAIPQGNGVYLIEEGIISIAGVWQVELVVIRPDAFDARTAFRFEAASSEGGGSAAIAPDPETGTLLLGIELVLIGFLFLGVGIPLGGWYSKTGISVMGPGIAAVFIGIVLVVNTQFGEQQQEIARNPIVPNPESLAIGIEIYGNNCQSCHGVSGRGDGPAAEGLVPPPADLIVHVPLHPDRALFGFIHDGIDGTAMAPLGDRLTQDEIWHVINYIRTLE